MTFTLLLTSVGGELAPQLVRFARESRRHEIRVVGVDLRPDAHGRHFTDAFEVVPPGAHPDYPEAMARIVERHRVDLVLPGSDEEALALAGARERVERSGARVAVSDRRTLELFTDKAACYARLGELGLPVPEWRLARTEVEVEAAVGDLVLRFGEAVVKPARARGGRGVHVITRGAAPSRPGASAREVHLDLATFRTHGIRAIANHLPCVVMKRLQEPVHDIDLLAWGGKAVRVVPRRRVSSAEPNEGHILLDDDRLRELGRRLVEAFDLTWLYDCDVMFDSDGSAAVLEVNPRPSGSLSAPIAAGVPLLDDLVSLALGEELPAIRFPSNALVVPYKGIASVGGGGR